MIENDFQYMRFDQKVSYLIENLKDLPNELTEQGIDILVQANETEYAAMLARDKGSIKTAIDILVDAGDYLWAGLIAKNANLIEESKQIYKTGLDYYIDMEMYGRALSAATALGLPFDEIDALYRKGIEVESRSMNLHSARAMIDSAMDSLEISLLGKQDELSQELMDAIKAQRDQMAKEDRAEQDKKEGD